MLVADRDVGAPLGGTLQAQPWQLGMVMELPVCTWGNGGNQQDSKVQASRAATHAEITQDGAHGCQVPSVGGVHSAPARGWTATNPICSYD